MRTLVVALLGGLIAAASAAETAAPPAARAKPGPVAPAPAPPVKAAPPRAPAYDVGSEVTVSGVVVDSHESKLRTDDPGLHLIVHTETEDVEVHTCPARFLKDLEFEIAKDDAVTIVGSRPGGGGIVLAREIKKGQTSLSLRDKAGAPIWR